MAKVYIFSFSGNFSAVWNNQVRRKMLHFAAIFVSFLAFKKIGHAFCNARQFTLIPNISIIFVATT